MEPWFKRAVIALSVAVILAMVNMWLMGRRVSRLESTCHDSVPVTQI